MYIGSIQPVHSRQEILSIKLLVPVEEYELLIGTSGPLFVL